MTETTEVPYNLNDIKAIMDSLGGAFSTSPLIGACLSVAARADPEVLESFLQQIREQAKRDEVNLKVMKQRQEEAIAPESGKRKRSGDETQQIETE